MFKSMGRDCWYLEDLSVLVSCRHSGQKVQWCYVIMPRDNLNINMQVDFVYWILQITVIYKGSWLKYDMHDYQIVSTGNWYFICLRPFTVTDDSVLPKPDCPLPCLISRGWSLVFRALFWLHATVGFVSDNRSGNRCRHLAAVIFHIGISG